MRMIRSLLIAFSTYSRIPVPQVEWNEENRRWSMCFFPLVGLVIGLLLWGWLALCGSLKIDPFLRGAVSAMIPLLLTGGIHMDGYMDTIDALASWQPKEKRLEILKDSHVGAFAVMGCAGYLLLSAALFAEAATADGIRFIGVFVLSRARCAVYAALCLLLWLISGGWIAPLCALAAVLCFLYYQHMAYKQFGGVTGDLAGWFLQVTELVLSAVIVIGGKLL